MISPRSLFEIADELTERHNDAEQDSIAPPPFAAQSPLHEMLLHEVAESLPDTLKSRLLETQTIDQALAWIAAGAIHGILEGDTSLRRIYLDALGTDPTRCLAAYSKAFLAAAVRSLPSPLPTRVADDVSAVQAQSWMAAGKVLEGLSDNALMRQVFLQTLANDPNKTSDALSDALIAQMARDLPTNFATPILSTTSTQEVRRWLAAAEIHSWYRRNDPKTASRFRDELHGNANNVPSALLRTAILKRLGVLDEPVKDAAKRSVNGEPIDVDEALAWIAADAVRAGIEDSNRRSLFLKDLNGTPHRLSHAVERMALLRVLDQYLELEAMTSDDGDVEKIKEWLAVGALSSSLRDEDASGVLQTSFLDAVKCNPARPARALTKAILENFGADYPEQLRHPLMAFSTLEEARPWLSACGVFNLIKDDEYVTNHFLAEVGNDPKSVSSSYLNSMARRVEPPPRDHEWKRRDKFGLWLQLIAIALLLFARTGLFTCVGAVLTSSPIGPVLAALFRNLVGVDVVTLEYQITANALWMMTVPIGWLAVEAGCCRWILERVRQFPARRGDVPPPVSWRIESLYVVWAIHCLLLGAAIAFRIVHGGIGFLSDSASTTDFATFATCSAIAVGLIACMFRTVTRYQSWP
jgi:hypothetical protein